MAKILPKLLILFTALAALGCGPEKAANDAPPPPTVFFPPDEVCGYPATSSAKALQQLGGGSWELPKTSDPGASFECIGAIPTTLLVSDGASIVQIDYSATGSDKGASIITTSYAATGVVKNESTYRNVFTSFVENTAKRGFGTALPELFKKKMSNLASYAQPGKGSVENFDIGTGFIALTREAAGSEAVSITVKFYPDVALKLSN